MVKDSNKNKLPKKKPEILVVVLKSRRDLRILLEEKWYRIPTSFLPKRAFNHVAFYQPAIFGKSGKRIKYYARVADKEIRTRLELLSDEVDHPSARVEYLKVTFRRIQELPKPVKNIIPRRVSFGFTTLKRLHSAKNILELYDVPATEQIVAGGLRQRGIGVFPEHRISGGGSRYRLDLAVFCRRGALAIECDNFKAHSGKKQQSKDKLKDAFLRRRGFRVVRLKERDIVERFGRCLARVEAEIKNLGGQTD